MKLIHKPKPEIPKFSTAFVQLNKPSLVRRLIKTRSDQSTIVGITDGTMLAASCRLLCSAGYNMVHTAIEIDDTCYPTGYLYMFFIKRGSSLPSRLSNVVYSGGKNFLHEVNACPKQGVVVNLFALCPQFEQIRARSHSGRTYTYFNKDNRV